MRGTRAPRRLEINRSLARSFVSLNPVDWAVENGLPLMMYIYSWCLRVENPLLLCATYIRLRLYCVCETGGVQDPETPRRRSEMKGYFDLNA